MKRKVKSLLLACAYLGLLFIVSDPWNAQTEEEEQSGSPKATVLVEIPSFLVLTVEDGVFLLNLGTSTTGGDLEQLEANKLRLVTNSKAGWSLLVWTESPDLGPLDQPNSTIRKPVEDFFWSNSLGNSGQLTHRRQEVASSKKTGRVKINMDYHIDIKESDPPGLFSVNLEYLAVLNQP